MRKALLLAVLLAALVFQPFGAAIIPAEDGRGTPSGSSHNGPGTPAFGGHLPVQAASVGRAPLYFVENRGQVPDEEVRFISLGAVSAHFTGTGVTYRVFGEPVPGPEEGLRDIVDPSLSTSGGSAPFHVFKVNFRGARPVVPVGIDPIGGKTSFFLGCDPSRWAGGLPGYSALLYENLFGGIDLVFRGLPEGLKYEFIVHPGADPSAIKLEYEGAAVSVSSNELTIHTSVGDVRDGSFLAYQEWGGARVPVEAGITAEGGSVSYWAVYDTARTLVIDPLIFSTYIGGISGDDVNDVLSDTVGNLYLCGETSSVDFPNTTGAYDNTYNNSGDVVVFKMDPAGSGLVFSTYIGSTSGDVSTAIAVDTAGNSFVVGYTFGAQFPTTVGAYDQSHNGGGHDGFALKLSADGSALVYSTFLGGSQDDLLNDVSVDESGNSYIIGITYSSGFPTTGGAFCTTESGGEDVVLVKLNDQGSALVYSTFLGGNNDEYGLGVIIDGSGNAYVTGGTRSAGFPVTVGAYDYPHGRGGAFVTAVNPQGSSLLYSALLGSSTSIVAGVSLTRDGSGDLIIGGYTSANDIPVSAQSFDSTYNGGNDGLVFKLSSNGTKLDYCTYIGGSQNDYIYDLFLNDQGDIVIAGNTGSPNFPVTPQAYDLTFNGSYDSFVSILNRCCSVLFNSTFFGGSSDEILGGASKGDSNTIVLAGYTSSLDFPNTTGAFDNTRTGPSDGFVSKMRLFTPPGPPQDFKLAYPGDRIVLDWKAPQSDGGLPVTGNRVVRGVAAGDLRLLADLPAGATTYADTNLTNGTKYFYAVAALNDLGEGDRSNTLNWTPGRAPSEPWNLTARAPDGQIILGWSPPNATFDCPVTSYNLFRGLAAGTMTLLAAIGDVTSFIDPAPKNGMVYYYCVSALNVVGEGPRSAVVSAVSYGIPSAPLNLSVQVELSPRAVVLNWTPPTDWGGASVLNYDVYRGYDQHVTAINRTGIPYYRDTSVSDGNVYYYRVSASTPRGEGNQSDIRVVAVGRTASAPQNLRAEPGDKKVRLSWELPADTGGFVPQQYNIYRGSDPLFLNFLLYVNTTSYDDTNLTNRATYYYGVSAVNQMGEGPTAAASAIPFKRAPKVQNFAAAASLRTVTLGWKEPPASDAGPVLSYNIYENMSGNLTLVSNTTETVDEFFNVSVGKHTYQVAALTDFCEGELSDESWVMVKNLLPFANFTVEPGIEGPVSTVFTFRSTARDLDGSLASWEWSFGDGRRGEGAVATHNFTSPGIFNVTLSVSDNDGGNASAWLKVKVTLEQTNRPPRITGWFPQSASPRTTVGNAVNFSISAIDDDGDRLSFNWSVNGRAQPGSNRSFFSYKAASAGTCKLRVEVSDGKSGVSREWLLTAAQSGGGGDAASWAAPLAIAVTVVAAGAGAGLFLVTRKRRAAAQPQPLAVGPAGQPQQAPLPPPIAYEPPPPPKEEKPTAEQMALFQRIDETAAGERPVTKAPQTARKPAGPAARPADLPRSSVMVPGPFPEETAAMRSLSSLPRGLPGTLASYSMDELAAVLITAPFAETADGDLIVKIGKRWYFGDPKQPDTYLQQWKPPQQ